MSSFLVCVVFFLRVSWYWGSFLLKGEANMRCRIETQLILRDYEVENWFSVLSFAWLLMVIWPSCAFCFNLFVCHVHSKWNYVLSRLTKNQNKNWHYVRRWRPLLFLGKNDGYSSHLKLNLQFGDQIKYMCMLIVPLIIFF